jgi:beta-xylosidase
VTRTALLAAALAGGLLAAAQEQPPWLADRGDGTYQNPVLFADYSDPDVIRVGNDYYLISSSFSAVPGLPVLQSRDLVNWRIIGHALPRLEPADVFASPQHGGGVWAPSIRFHDGRFWIYYPDPDRGISLVTARDPRGPWSRPVLVKAGKGLIDPCPLWDDDGHVYLVHAWARSRAGFANLLTLMELSADGTRPLDDGRVLIDGNALSGYTTLEGPKFYKRDGWYYVFAPAGGVKQGWQSVFRSRSIRGPYESRIVLAQGTTDVNGPHQGALVDTQNGQSWFLHFQDRDAYGRVVHLQPVTWRDGWPVIGDNGQPVTRGRKPDVGRSYPIEAPQTSDEFDRTVLGLQWQWQGDTDASASSLSAHPGDLRLFAQQQPGNLWTAAHLLLQKLPAPAFVTTTRMDARALNPGDEAGLIVFGSDYAWVGVRRDDDRARVVLRGARDADRNTPETEDATRTIATTDSVFLRATFSDGAVVRFSYGTDGVTFTSLGDPFTAKPGRWVGAKVGLFASRASGTRGRGFADFEWFRVSAQRPAARYDGSAWHTAGRRE